MQRSVAAIAALLAFLTCAATPPVRAEPVVAGYYSGEIPVAKIPAAELTNVIYAFAEPAADNTCHAPSAKQRADFAQLRALRAAHPNLHVTLSIGGWGAAPNYSDVALTPASRAAFARTCIQQYVAGQDLEGIDIDWEFPVHGGDTIMHNRPQDRSDATALLREIRSQLHALSSRTHRRYYLTIAIPAGRWQTGGPYDPRNSYDLAAVARTVDWIDVMTYDMNNIFSPYSNFNDPLYPDPNDPTPGLERRWNNLSGAVKYFEAHGVPADKIVLGMAFYGRGFRNVASKNAGLYSRFNGIFDETPYAAVKSKMLTNPAWQKHWSDTAQAPWIYNAREHVFFSYDDPRSMAIKAAFARAQHLRGTMFWVLGEDDAQNSLLNTLQP